MAEFCEICGERLKDKFRLKCPKCYQDELDEKDQLDKILALDFLDIHPRFD